MNRRQQLEKRRARLLLMFDELAEPGRELAKIEDELKLLDLEESLATEDEKEST